MKEFLTGDTLYMTVVMASQSASHLILVVEGADDQHFLKRHAGKNLLLISGLGGRQGVLLAAERASEESVGRVRFLVDSDLDPAFGQACDAIDAILTTDTHDLFMDLVHAAPGDFDYVVETHSRSAVRAGVELNAVDIRREAMRLAGRLAQLRVASGRRSWGLKFSEFPFGALGSSGASLSDLAEVVVRRSSSTVTVSELVEEAEAFELQATVEIDRMVGDHDFFGASAMCMRQRHVKGVSAEQLLNSFMAGANCRSLKGLSWISELMVWAGALGVTALNCPGHELWGDDIAAALQ